MVGSISAPGLSSEVSCISTLPSFFSLFSFLGWAKDQGIERQARWGGRKLTQLALTFGFDHNHRNGHLPRKLDPSHCF